MEDMKNIFKDFNKEAEYIQAKREKAIEYLGSKWIVAKSNYVKKKDKDDSASV